MSNHKRPKSHRSLKFPLRLWSTDAESVLEHSLWMVGVGNGTHDANGMPHNTGVPIHISGNTCPTQEMKNSPQTVKLRMINSVLPRALRILTLWPWVYTLSTALLSHQFYAHKSVHKCAFRKESITWHTTPHLLTLFLEFFWKECYYCCSFLYLWWHYWQQ